MCTKALTTLLIVCALSSAVLAAEKKVVISDDDVEGAVSGDVSPLEKRALISLYNATNGLMWDTAWPVEEPNPGSACTWYGVECSKGSRPHVTELNLMGNFMSGTLNNVSLHDLFMLESFDVSSNAIAGYIPGDELDDLKLLRYILLNDNEFTGPLPDFGELLNYSLEEVDLSRNLLDGSLQDADWLNRAHEQAVPVHLQDNPWQCPVPMNIAEYTGAVCTSSADIEQVLPQCAFEDQLVLVFGGPWTIDDNGGGDGHYFCRFGNYSAMPARVVNNRTLACQTPVYAQDWPFKETPLYVQNYRGITITEGHDFWLLDDRYDMPVFCEETSYDAEVLLKKIILAQEGGDADTIVVTYNDGTNVGSAQSASLSHTTTNTLMPNMLIGIGALCLLIVLILVFKKD